MKDAADLKLEEMFTSGGLADNGFSSRIERRIRRQMWVRRLALPVAFVVGGAIAFKPISMIAPALAGIATSMADKVGANVTGLPTEGLPPLSLIFMGGTLLIACLMAGRLMED